MIISLLGSAISQAKTYRCPRTRRQLGKLIQVVVGALFYLFLKLVVQMAEEYYHAKDYKKALT
jgi:hypothetical protein